MIFVIKNLRRHKNISLNDLSDKTGLTSSYLSKLENNKLDSCSTKSLEKIADSLEVNVKDLFYTVSDIDYLKEELNTIVDVYGLSSKEALEMSQIIDLLVNIIMNIDNK